MALSLQSTQNSRGVSVRPLSSMRQESLPMLAERLLASRAAALVAGLPAELYSGALLAAWPPSPPAPLLPPPEMERARKRRRTPKLDESTNTAPPSPPSSGSSPGASDPPRDKLFTCKVCSRSFGYKHVLQNHERTHTGEKPFECGECHKRFTRDHHLKTHLRLHTGEKPYSCPHCPRHFVQVANLRRHLRVHTGERPYACARCPARFSDSNQLKAHALVHEGDAPFACRCGARFRRRQAAALHRCAGTGCEPEASSPPAAAAADWRWDEWPEQTEPEDLSLPRRPATPDSPPTCACTPRSFPAPRAAEPVYEFLLCRKRKVGPSQMPLPPARPPRFSSDRYFEVLPARNAPKNILDNNFFAPPVSSLTLPT